jgi:hypothetical protein
LGERIHRLEQRLGFENHAFAPAEWAVIDGVMPVMGESTQVVHPRINEARFTRATHDSVVKRTGKKFRKYGDNFELHGRDSVTQQASAAIQIAQALREDHINAFPIHVNASAEFSRERDQNFTIACIDGKQWRATREFDVAHGTERRRCAPFPDFASDKIADKIVSLSELSALLDGHLNFQPAQTFRVLDAVDIREMKYGLAAAPRR